MKRLISNRIGLNQLLVTIISPNLSFGPYSFKVEVLVPIVLKEPKYDINGVKYDYVALTQSVLPA